MSKFPFDPPVLNPRDLPSILLIMGCSIGFVAIFAAFMQFRLYPDVAYWKVFVLVLFVNVTALIMNFLIVRPLRGMPPIFRKRPQDNFETWLGGNGVQWTRLPERYSIDELIFLSGLLVVLVFAMFLWSTRM